MLKKLLLTTAIATIAVSASAGERDSSFGTHTGSHLNNDFHSGTGFFNGGIRGGSSASAQAETWNASYETQEVATTTSYEAPVAATTYTTTTTASASTGSFGSSNQGPVNARAGECFAKIKTPEVTKVVKEQVLATEASESVSIIPAQYEYVEQEIVVKEASEELITIPATYTTVTEEIVVQPAREELVTVPAQYETISEQVLVRPETTQWKKGRGPLEKANEITGEIMCLVTTPAQYKTVTRKVVSSPATTQARVIPAQTKTITKQVVAEPARVETRVIPAQTKTVKTQVLVQPAQEVRTPIEPQYKEVLKTVVVQPGGLEWKQILCETNTTAGVVRKIQNALANKGYYKGPIDGIYGSQTTNAAANFQQDNGMSGNGITFETLELLGVSI